VVAWDAGVSNLKIKIGAARLALDVEVDDFTRSTDVAGVAAPPQCLNLAVCSLGREADVYVRQSSIFHVGSIVRLLGIDKVVAPIVSSWSQRDGDRVVLRTYVHGIITWIGLKDRVLIWFKILELVAAVITSRHLVDFHSFSI